MQEKLWKEFMKRVSYAHGNKDFLLYHITTNIQYSNTKYINTCIDVTFRRNHCNP